MADRVLREVCTHGRYERHLWDIATGSQTCPGGRDITDAELMRIAAQVVYDHPDGTMSAEFAVAASKLIGDSDE